jgi:hypothetical protein
MECASLTVAQISPVEKRWVPFYRQPEMLVTFKAGCAHLGLRRDTQKRFHGGQEVTGAWWRVAFSRGRRLALSDWRLVEGSIQQGRALGDWRLALGGG